MIDTHAHLDFKDFDEDREEVIWRAFDNGVKAMINIGVDLATSRKSIELAEKHEHIFAAVGFHPHDADEILNSARDDDLVELKKLAEHKKVVSIGEVGLDYSRFNDAQQIEKQKKLFVKQLDLARELNLPVIVHCRDAWEDLFEIISKFYQSSAFPSASSADSSKPSFTKFVLHCYSGEKQDTEKFLKLPNVYFSFSGNITYPKPIDRAEKLAEVVRMIQLERIMLDSDCPFLSPQEFRGKRNEPAYVKYIAQKISDIKHISVEEVERATDENARKFFGRLAAWPA
jgi:TatD DNase family protein